MHLVAGLARPTHGRIVVDGIDLTNAKDDEVTVMRRQRVAMIFQTFNLQAAWTAAENIAFQLKLAGFPKNERKGKVDAVLGRMGLSHRRNHYPDEMSRGEQQRVAIARALVVEPRILLADEPTGSLDSIASDEIVQSLVDLSHEDKVTTLLITHDPAAAALADRQIRLKDGQIISDRTRNYEYSEIVDAQRATAEQEAVESLELTDKERKLLN